MHKISNTLLHEWYFYFILHVKYISSTRDWDYSKPSSIENSYLYNLPISIGDTDLSILFTLFANRDFEGKPIRTTWHVNLDSEDGEEVQQQLEYLMEGSGVPEGHQLVANAAKRVWEELYTCKKHVSE